MPGSRLSEQDRRRIASWLAEGLGYAEIARRLGRPTSTVSREVARNSGSGGYRADHAQQATERRARRRGPAVRPRAPAAANAYRRNPEAVRAFAEDFAALMVQIGLPRIAARVLAHLVTTDSGALTSADLVRQLQVSPASVSKAIGYLVGLDVVRRERAPRRRREMYVVGGDLWLRAWTASARKNVLWADTARRGVAIFGATTPAGARLNEMARFFARLSANMVGGPGRAAVSDMLTVLAALVHAGEPLTVAQLSTALGWHPDRVTSALRGAERHPEVCDPVTVRAVESGTYSITAGGHRLTTAQREALGGHRQRRSAAPIDEGRPDEVHRCQPVGDSVPAAEAPAGS
ncbi:MarR family transcriptional regulator [Microtetraspora fusca]|uniref:MarR family transcriptional regulator n=1 Tax=Microtetraspora fusca TaxID=1997 RepID=UPI0009FC7BE2|nr:MarR family transcriptional regulator [Microtetraspora fusca]